MAYRRRIVALLGVLVTGCASAPRQAAKAEPDRPAGPAWIEHIKIEKDRLCGLGVAGPGFEDSPYPKVLARERAVRNLAGILGTSVEEAIIDRTTTSGTSIRTARVLQVDDQLVQQIDGLAQPEYWLDEQGVGPFGQPGFTYAHACISAAQAANAFRLDASSLATRTTPARVHPEVIPRWMAKTGKQPGGRLCAVGVSLPTFHPDQSFAIAVEDVRGQLAEVIETLVSSYYEELTTDKQQFVEAMTVATTQALAKGVIVTHYWFDRDGIGPEAKKRSTYGWGCAYPVEVLKASLNEVSQELPDEQQATIAKVRERAVKAFDELERQEGKHGP